MHVGLAMLLKAGLEQQQQLSSLHHLLPSALIHLDDLNYCMKEKVFAFSSKTMSCFILLPAL